MGGGGEMVTGGAAAGYGDQRTLLKSLVSLPVTVLSSYFTNTRSDQRDIRRTS